MFKRALILSASAGYGHIAAAKAIEAALAASGGADEIHHLDMFQYTSGPLRLIFRNLCRGMANQARGFWAWLYGGLYDYTDRPWHQSRVKLALTKLNSRAFMRMIRDYQPDLVICDYILPAWIVSAMKANGELNGTFAIVVIDFHVHSTWLCRNCDHYFVAGEDSHAYLETLGVDTDKITATGNPINPVFAQHKDNRQMRIKYGLREHGPTILVTSGDSGVGPVETIVNTLLTIRHSAQIVVICGRNTKLKAALEHLASQLGNSNHVALKVVGYTTDMDEYMAASDILIGKAGALTTFESLAKGLAIVIVNPIPGHEERNSDILLERGVAVRCNNLAMLAYKINQILDDPERHAEMQRRSRQLGYPNAANDIVGKLLALNKQ